jgi:hypothetical protein
LHSGHKPSIRLGASPKRPADTDRYSSLPKAQIDSYRKIQLLGRPKNNKGIVKIICL